MEAKPGVPGSEFFYGDHGPMYEQSFGNSIDDDDATKLLTMADRYTTYTNEAAEPMVTDNCHMMPEAMICAW